MSIELYEILKKADALSASDIHLSSGNYPALRVDGKIIFIGESILTNDEIDDIIKKCLPVYKYDEYKENKDIDSAYEIKGFCRYRINAFYNTNGAGIAFRPIRTVIPELSQLALPDSVRKICEMREGLVLVTGPTGSGKSTTLASIINEINKKRNARIITIEDPIEYIHKPQSCMIEQREIGKDSSSFAKALRAALREDPDIILVGEMRDLESISIALTAAETGHLVLSTLHTLGSAKTIDRLVDVFPTDSQRQIRTQLSMALKAVLSQRLIPKASGKGRIAAFEMMFVNSAISNMIRESKTANINQALQTGGLEGMIILEKSIENLYSQGLITREDALSYSADQGRMTKYFD